MTYEETVWVLNDKPIHDYDRVAIFKDRHPVIRSHLLFIPKENNNECIAEAYKKALDWAERMILTGGIDGVNIGQNIGRAAGQSVMWPHVHFIPRQKGDSDKNASNGIRLSHPRGIQIKEYKLDNKDKTEDEIMEEVYKKELGSSFESVDRGVCSGKTDNQLF